MLKITGWSLLLGAAALIAGLILLYPPPAGDPQAAPLIWNPGAGQSGSGNARVVDGNLQLALNKWGAGVVTLTSEPVAAQDYAFVHIALEESSPDLNVLLTWTDAQDRMKTHRYALESELRASLWIATAELEGWSGEIANISLFMLGRPGETALIRDFSLFPASPWRQLQALYSDIAAFEPWNRAAMNTYTGVTNVASFYPVPLAISLFLLSLLAYAALVVLSRGRLRFNRASVALIFLASWIALDLTWQHRLWRQLADTYRTFAHVDAPQRQAVGPDAPLVHFVSQIRPQLADGSRIFVASSDHYNGMRVAYYLYPLNVYWSLHAPEVPYNEFLRAGDYIALVKPSTFQFNRGRGSLSGPERGDRRAQLIFSDPVGTLVRLQ